MSLDMENRVTIVFLVLTFSFSSGFSSRSFGSSSSSSRTLPVLVQEL